MQDSGWAADPYYLYELDRAEGFLKEGEKELGLAPLRANPKLDFPIMLFEVWIDIRPE